MTLKLIPKTLINFKLIEENIKCTFKEGIEYKLIHRRLSLLGSQLTQMNLLKNRNKTLLIIGAV